MKTKKHFSIFVSGLLLLFASVDAADYAPGASDHNRYMKGPYQNGISVTKECLKCHEKEGKDILESAHWLWKGPTPFIEGYEGRNDLGKKNLINNF